MDNAVTQEVFKRIDALAEKLGTTAQYMWPKLVAYTQGVAIAQIFLVGVGIIIGAVGLYWSVKRGIKEDWDTALEFVGACVFGVLLAFLTIYVFAAGSVTVAAVISPEAAAFYKMVGR